MATDGFNLIYGSIWSLHFANYTVSFRTTVGTALVGASERCKSWRSESNGGNYPALWSDYTMEAWNGRVSISIDLILVSVLLSKREDEGFYTTSMGIMGVPLLLPIPDRNITMILEDFSYLPEIEASVIAISSTAILLSVYLPKAGEIEDLLKPAMSSLWLMSICIAVAYAQGDQLSLSLSVGIFMIATVWLVARGELRRELQTVTKMSSRRALALEKKSRA